MRSGRSIIRDVESMLNESLFDSDAPRSYEARLIVEHITGDSYSELLTSQYELNSKQQSEISNVIKKRNDGIPLAYVLKHVSFRELDIYVDSRVLIPRPETEFVVECALNVLKKLDGSKTVVDIGTGSGAIALSLAYESSDTQVLATDISLEAIDVARLNGVGLGTVATRVTFFYGDLFSPIPEEYKGNIDMIISNPPYIGLDEKCNVQESVLAHEPPVALFSGTRGDEHYRAICEQAHGWLSSKGRIIFEIAPRHVELMYELSNQYNYSQCRIEKDLLGRERVCMLTY